jgi:hypothetical protein
MNRTSTFALSESARLTREAAAWRAVAERADAPDVPLLDLLIGASEPASNRARAVCDASKRTADRYGIELVPGRLALPWELLSSRDLQSSPGSAGGFINGSQLGPAAAALRGPSACIGRLGVPVIEDPKTTSWPRVDGKVTAAWMVDEATAPAEVNPSFGLRAGTRNTVTANVDLSASLTRTSPAAQQVVGDELRAALAQAIDAAIIGGSGASGEPLGILGSGGVATVTGTSLNRAGILQAQRTVIRAGLREPSSFAAVTTPEVAELLAARVATGGNDETLWRGPLHDGALLGLRAISSENVPTATLLAGDWASGVLLHVLGPILIEANACEPTKFRSGIIELRAMASVSVVVLQPGAFVKAESIT